MIQFLEEVCVCSEKETFPDGNKPLWFNNEQKAMDEFKKCLIEWYTNKRKYFAIHFNNKHILIIHNFHCQCQLCKKPN